MNGTFAEHCYALYVLEAEQTEHTPLGVFRVPFRYMGKT